MVTKGGYKLIDFGGVDISTSKTISGIYNKIADTGKRIVGCNIKLDTTEFKELTLDVKPIENGYELSNSILKITITNANAVVGVFGLYNGFSDDNASTKKIYFHPIFIETTDTLKGRISCSILNNTPDKLNTYNKLITEIRSWGLTKANIIANGLFYDTNSSKAVVINAFAVTSSDVKLYGAYVDGSGLNSGFTITGSDITNITDEVNAIN